MNMNPNSKMLSRKTHHLRKTKDAYGQSIFKKKPLKASTRRENLAKKRSTDQLTHMIFDRDNVNALLPNHEEGEFQYLQSPDPVGSLSESDTSFAKLPARWIVAAKELHKEWDVKHAEILNYLFMLDMEGWQSGCAACDCPKECIEFYLVDLQCKNELCNL
jgi:hypothetical protein